MGKVLLINDEEALVSVSHRLERAGHVVEATHDAQAALEHAKQLRPDATG
jgi:CheY-like chemotaxis protein